MKTLEYKTFRGLQIICTKCGKTIHKKSKTHNGCKHPLEKQRYKIVLKLPNSGGLRKSKNLSTRTYSEAVIECINFEKALETTDRVETNVCKPELIIDCLLMFTDYLENIDIPAHMQRTRTSGHINRTVSYIQNFLTFLKDSNYDIHNLRVDAVSDVEVGKYYQFIDSKNQSNSSFNGRIKALRAFHEYLISKHEYSISNPWKKVKFRPEPTSNASFSKQDFIQLKSVITPDDAIMKIGKTSRNMYRDWIIDLIELKVFTGRRDEELVYMKWNMVHFEEGRAVFLKSPNKKVNRAKNITRELDFEFSFIPVGEELLELLTRLGLSKFNGTSEYIVAPSNLNRKDILLKIGKQFTFFFKRLDRDYIRTFKHLRKTFITMESINAATVSLQHGNFRTTEKHYIDKEFIAKMLAKNGFRIYPKH